MEYLCKARRALSVYVAFDEVCDALDAIDIVLRERHRILYRRIMRWWGCYRTRPVSDLEKHDAHKLNVDVLYIIAWLYGNSDLTDKRVNELINKLRVLLRTLPLYSKEQQAQTNATDAFHQSIRISPELGEFLKLEVSDIYSKVYIIHRVYDYINKNNLHDKNDFRVVRADSPLRKLFNASDEEMVTYFNVGTYLEHHFENV